MAGDGGADAGIVALPNAIDDCEGYGAENGCATHKICTSTASSDAYDFEITFSADGSSATGTFSVSCRESDGGVRCASSYAITMTKR